MREGSRYEVEAKLEDGSVRTFEYEAFWWSGLRNKLGNEIDEMLGLEPGVVQWFRARLIPRAPLNAGEEIKPMGWSRWLEPN